MAEDFEDRVAGALYGLAIGDAMGAPVEGWRPERIMERFSDVRAFLPVTKPDDPWGTKGAGRITDDTLMTEALIRAYATKGGHLDAYDFKAYFLPEIVGTEVWVPEKGRVMPIFERLFWPEKYPWIRLVVNNADPRTAGVGNLVNCGASMYVMPVGAVNAGDPRGAYQEAATFAAAHNESFALEAAAVAAACVACAFGSGATVDDVLASAAELARAGTGLAVQRCVAVARDAHDVPAFVRAVRDAFRPFDQRGDDEPGYDPSRFPEHSNTGRPAADRSIEELPVALAALAFGRGDFERVLRAAVFYGRDCDSSAAMAGALWGALFGRARLPANLCAGVEAASRRDFAGPARTLANTARLICLADGRRQEARTAAIQGRES